MLAETTRAGSIAIVDGPTIGDRTSIAGRGHWRTAREIERDIEIAADVITRRAIDLGSTCALDWAAHARERGGMTQAEVARVFATTKARIGQIEAGAYPVLVSALLTETRAEVEPREWTAQHTPPRHIGTLGDDGHRRSPARRAA